MKLAVVLEAVCKEPASGSLGWTNDRREKVSVDARPHLLSSPPGRGNARWTPPVLRKIIRPIPSRVLQKDGERFSLSAKGSWGRVALLGIAQRTIRIKCAQKSRKDPRVKPLPESIKTIADLIQVKRMEKNLTRCHLAAKMGIATSLVCSWESSIRQPDNQQLEILSSILGFNAKDFETLISTPTNLACLDLENQT